MTAPVKALAFCGSLREGSYNRMALRAAVELCPDGMQMQTCEVGHLPQYNDDVRAAGYPPAVQAMREAIAASDAFLFVSPEYNYSVPGFLKNAIDWASRPPNPPFDGKVAAIMGASPGSVGTARMQYHLRQICVFLNLHVVPRPECMISQAPSRFDEQGRLIDAKTREQITALLVALRDLSRKLRP